MKLPENQIGKNKNLVQKSYISKAATLIFLNLGRQRKIECASLTCTDSLR